MVKGLMTEENKSIYKYINILNNYYSSYFHSTCGKLKTTVPSVGSIELCRCLRNLFFLHFNFGVTNTNYIPLPFSLSHSQSKHDSV